MFLSVPIPIVPNTAGPVQVTSNPGMIRLVPIPTPTELTANVFKTSNECAGLLGSVPIPIKDLKEDESPTTLTLLKVDIPLLE